MTESILALCLAAGFISLLVFIFLSERQRKETREREFKNMKDLMNVSYRDFLKHIEKLEKMTLPKPVTTKDVQSVLDRVGEVSTVGAFENEIEQEPNKGVEMPSDEWTGYINAETKVAFEDEELPAVVESLEPPAIQ